MIFKRSELPLDDDQFQAFLSVGLIKQKKSGEEKISKILGVSYRPNPNEIPRFDVDESIISELLSRGKFDPQLADNIEIRMTLRSWLANQEIKVTNTSIYIKVLHSKLITEIGFSFESEAASDLQNSLNKAQVQNTINAEKRVNIPFFTTTWVEGKNGYQYFNKDMSNFLCWLKTNFPHCNITHEVERLLKNYQEKVNHSHILNSAEVYEAITQIKRLFQPMPQKNSEPNSSLAAQIRPPHSSCLPSSSLPQQSKVIEIPDEFKCPITTEPMEYPVIFKDGFSYEKNAIEEWLSKNHTSPMTGVEYKENNLIASLIINRNLKEAIESFRNKYPELFEKQESKVNYSF